VPTDAEWKQLEMHLGMSQSEVDSTWYRGTGIVKSSMKERRDENIRAGFPPPSGYELQRSER
jgi:hypothetical protein